MIDKKISYKDQRLTKAQQARQLYKNGGTMEDIGFSIVKPSKDGAIFIAVITHT